MLQAHRQQAPPRPPALGVAQGDLLGSLVLKPHLCVYTYLRKLKKAPCEIEKKSRAMVEPHLIFLEGLHLTSYCIHVTHAKKKKKF